MNEWLNGLPSSGTLVIYRLVVERVAAAEAEIRFQ